MLTIVRRQLPPWALPRSRRSAVWPMPDEEPQFLTRRELAIWRAATRSMRGGATAAAYVCRNLVFATGTAVHTNLVAIAPAGHGLSLVEFGISFDGVTASAVPVLVELCQSTQATGGSGAASPPAAVQVRGRASGGQAPTVSHNHTSEPTALTVVRQWLVSPNGGLFVYPVPLGREIECDASGGTIKALAARVTSAASVNSYCYMEVEALG